MNQDSKTTIDTPTVPDTKSRRLIFRKRQLKFWVILSLVVSCVVIFTISIINQQASKNTSSQPDSTTVSVETKEAPAESPLETPSNKPSEETEKEQEVENSTAPSEVPITEISDSANIKESGSKIIYLTFDDGPGPYTAKLLDILKQYNVKVTFFVTGAGDDALIAREYNEGHAIGLHTFTHDYAYIYSSIGNFFSDLYQVQQRVQNATGYTSTLIRFPGGSSNTVSTRYDGGTRIMSNLVNEVSARGFTYFDWNISSGDAGAPISSDAVYQNVINNLKPDYSVVLQHDIKDYSVDAVARIIEYGIANGYTFSTLDSTSFTAHHGVNN